MSFALLPKKQREWDLACIRSCIFVGSVLLLVQFWVRVFLGGWMRQNIEELLAPFPAIPSLLLLCGVVGGSLHRERPLGIVAFLICLALALITFVPILLREGVYD